MSRMVAVASRLVGGCAVGVEFDDVAVGVSDEDRGHVAEAERTGDRNIIPGHECPGVVECTDGERNVGDSGMFLFHVHEDVRPLRYGCGAEQIEDDAVCVAHDHGMPVCEARILDERESKGFVKRD